MTPAARALLAALAGCAAVAGVLVAVAGGYGWAAPETTRRRSRTSQRLRRLVGLDRTGRAARAENSLRLAGVAVGALVWLASSWPVAGILAGLVVVRLPWLLRPGGDGKRRIERLEALEEWVRRLADVHTAGISLQQAVHLSLRTVPGPLAEPISTVVARLQYGWSPEDAYRALGDELDDSTADKVIALLLLHVKDQGPGLSTALRELAEAVADEIGMRRKVEADREKPRSNARWVTVFALGVMGVAMLAGDYMAPYRTVGGQIIMLIFAGLFTGALLWMRQMATARPLPRFLSSADRTASEADQEDNR